MENVQRSSFCKESETNLDEEERDEFASIMNGDDGEEYIQMLLQREIINDRLQTQQNCSQISGGDCILGARLDGIRYILKKRDFLGFRFQTAYLSVVYLDRFLSRRLIGAEKSWIIRLVSMSCLSLAAKMEERRVPPLIEFSFGDFKFESRTMQRMELFVLNKLEWKMRSVTPFAFINFFVKNFYENDPSKGVPRIVETILGALRDEKVIRHKPSVIAASATLVALDKKLTRDVLEHRISSLTSTGILEIEDFIACYYQIHEAKTGKFELNEEIKSPELSPMHFQSPSPTFVSDAKRKRLQFNESDQVHDVHNKKQKQ